MIYTIARTSKEFDYKKAYIIREGKVGYAWSTEFDHSKRLTWDDIGAVNVIIAMLKENHVDDSFKCVNIKKHRKRLRKKLFEDSVDELSLI